METASIKKNMHKYYDFDLLHIYDVFIDKHFGRCKCKCYSMYSCLVFTPHLYNVIVMKRIRNCTFLFSFNTRSSTKLSKQLYRLQNKSHDIMLILIF
jgi:hypothetical protein